MLKILKTQFIQLGQSFSSLSVFAVPAIESNHHLKRTYAKRRTRSIYGRYIVYIRNRAVKEWYSGRPRSRTTHYEYWVMELGEKWSTKRVHDLLAGVKDTEPDVWSIRDKNIVWKELVHVVDVAENYKRMSPVRKAIVGELMCAGDFPPSLCELAERRACLYAEWLSKQKYNPMRERTWKEMQQIKKALLPARSRSGRRSKRSGAQPPQPSAQIV